jgi:sulfopropanediol 3-dehydrogenase
VAWLKMPTARLSGGSAPDTVKQVVATIVKDVRDRGDAAVREFSERFDSWSPEAFRLDDVQIEGIVATVPQQVIDDIQFAQEQVRRFAEHQLASMTQFEVETMPGVVLGQRHIPVSSAGAYVPGGRFPLLASAHMTILTAKVAGVARVAACTPPIHGEVPAATVAAIHLAGADEIYLMGGAHAVAALALGTETVARVDLFTGPGNAYVAEAKRQLFGDVGIDLLAGPTEILVIADDTADPFIVAVDLLSQGEHGPDSPAVLITTSERVGRAVLDHVRRLLPTMPTRDYAESAWRDHGAVRLAADLDEAFAIADDYASEHVEVLIREPRQALDSLHDYGALFLGEGTCVSYGDKVIGTNHVLPTRGAARYTGGLWVGKFLKTVTYQEVTNTAASALLGEVCARASRVEHFEGHARAGDLRTARAHGTVPSWAADLVPPQPTPAGRQPTTNHGDQVNHSTAPRPTTTPAILTAQAHAVMLPIIDEHALGAQTLAFLRRGGRSLLLGENRQEYLDRSMSTDRRRSESPTWLRDLTREAVEAAGADMLFAVDHEVGGIQRLHHLIGPFPPIEQVAAMADTDLVALGALTARRMCELGVNLVLAPILDTDEGRSPMLRDRVLSADAAEVARIGAALVRGLEDGGVSATAKHFPGHRRAHLDPHTEVVDIAASRDEMAAEIAPFRSAVDAGVRVVMMGPAAFTAIDPHESASLSAPLISILRRELGFTGVVLTDDLDMASIRRGRNLDDVALTAINAGADLLLVPDPATAMTLADHLVRATEGGKLDPGRLAEASARVGNLVRQTVQGAVVGPAADLP